ncbi:MULTISPECIES: hypothetical protein [Citrobacter]|nr:MULTISPECIES: hypothetical protein [Citrobacter]MDM2947946.1 hypothetical protein [Citrobacter sp. CK207]WOJ19985.1 hypothetical protein R1015_12245 [Citrobacter koseri]
MTNCKSRMALRLSGLHNFYRSPALKRLMATQARLIRPTTVTNE